MEQLASNPVLSFDNIKASVQYKHGATGTIAFVGSHLDVVPANPETWEKNPFKLIVEVS